MSVPVTVFVGVRNPLYFCKIVFFVRGLLDGIGSKRPTEKRPMQNKYIPYLVQTYHPKYPFYFNIYSVMSSFILYFTIVQPVTLKVQHKDKDKCQKSFIA